ncbi:hypothetical protein [Aurantimonas coralicida]|uniref:hypothetical protein n=1 Tax=Aurantimonas coralicida TaxID=182270 RepID=UPI001D196623|nr:hypothetical protein [Aurantimonas coralicida]MCC4299345.1 hypothetical protein [Aurantimonas coralicida]
MTTARPLQVAACDRFGPQHTDLGAFVESLCGAVAIEWRRAGVEGVRILEAELQDGCLLLVTGPGQAPLDRAAVRTFLEQQRQPQ